jgi:hypothetical protein
MEYKISKHCLEQIILRGITKDQIEAVLNNPGSILKQDDEITVYQSLTSDGNFLIRILLI